MIAAIHQPNFLPWIGYFYKMLKCDRFVFLDDVQYVRRGYTNRVKIKTENGEKWLTVPVKKKGRYDQLITEVELEPGDHWKNKILNTLQCYYGKTPHFKIYFPEIETMIMQEHSLLTELNIQLIRKAAEWLMIETPVIRSSELKNISGHSTDRLVSICKEIKAEKYLSGFGGQKYQERETFNENGIELLIYDFKHPEYSQLWGDFIPGQSVMDLLFNCGTESIEIIKNVSDRK
jgi:hypothetical protein